jgi:16S rRNA (cytosine1402-N4)-methyltransferase
MICNHRNSNTPVIMNGATMTRGLMKATMRMYLNKAALYARQSVVHTHVSNVVFSAQHTLSLSLSSSPSLRDSHLYSFDRHRLTACHTQFAPTSLYKSSTRVRYFHTSFRRAASSGSKSTTSNKGARQSSGRQRRERRQRRQPVPETAAEPIPRDGMSDAHTPVLLDHVIKYLAPSDMTQPCLYVDGTIGAGGHALAMLEMFPNVHVLGIDRDPVALDICKETLLKRHADRVTLVHGTFAELSDIVAKHSLPAPDRLLFDLGVSSMQLDDGSRGFSFMRDGPLDARMSSSGETMLDVLNRLSTEELADVIYELGDERFSRRIAKFIKEALMYNELHTTHDLVRICRRCYPKKREGRINPATRTFQALRIYVNAELDQVTSILRDQLLACMPINGRAAIISFHSGEDRLVKTYFHAWKEAGRVELLPNKKPILATQDEVEANPRARSARLRIMQKIK